MLFNPKKNYYEILDIGEIGTTPEILKSAFRKKALIHHPDKGGNAEKFKEINEAYSVLNDSYLKRCYDASRPPKKEEVMHGGIRFYGNGAFATTSYTSFKGNTSGPNYWTGFNW